jgi:hypothetical protein
MLADFSQPHDLTIDLEARWTEIGFSLKWSGKIGRVQTVLDRGESSEKPWT